MPARLTLVAPVLTTANTFVADCKIGGSHVVVGAIVVGVAGLVLAGSAGRYLIWLQRIRRLSDVTGTVVGRDRQFTGKGSWTYPVVEFSTRDGRLI